MTSVNLNRYIKEYLKRQPKTLSMSQIEELIEYDAWLDQQGVLMAERVEKTCPHCEGELQLLERCISCQNLQAVSLEK